MHKNARLLTTLLATGSLLAAPAAGLAAKGGTPGSGKAKPANAKSKKCAKADVTRAYVVGGTLVSVTADDPATPASEATVTLKVTSANAHARRSGEIADQDATKKGVQLKDAEYTVAAGDAFTLKLNGFEGTDTPSVGDKVKVHGKIKLTKKACAPAGTSLADRYATPDVKKVTITDRDPDA